jgi:hypothetical protein
MRYAIIAITLLLAGCGVSFTPRTPLPAPTTVRELTARPCQICRHPERLRIELARLSGLSLDLVAARFQVHRDAVHRHMLHLSDADRAALIADLPIKELVMSRRALAHATAPAAWPLAHHRP